MDSHLYDYKQINDVTREQIITNLVKECEIVHGSAAFLWHPHTLASDYGWSNGFEMLLDLVGKREVK